MIFWRGYGFLAPVLGFLGLIAAQLSANFIFDDELYYQDNLWPKLLGLIAGSTLVWFVGKALNRSLELSEKKSSAQHTFMFIRMEYWGPIFFLLFVLLEFFN